MGAPCALLVGSPSDELLLATRDALTRRNIAVRAVPPHQLATLSLHLAGGQCSVDGQPLGALLWRAYPDSRLSDCFAASDRAFADAEIGAAWLAVINAPSLLAINRYDADSWFDGLGWPCLRRCLKDAGIPLSPFAYGDTSDGSEGSHWLPYISTGPAQRPPPQAARAALGAALSAEPARTAATVVCGHLLDGAPEAAISHAARALAHRGVHIARLYADAIGRILLVDPQPAITDRNTAARAAAILADTYGPHLHPR